MQLFVFLLLALGLIGLALGGYLTPIITHIIKSYCFSSNLACKTLPGSSKPDHPTPGCHQLYARKIRHLEAENSRLQVQIVELQQQVTEAQLLSTLVDYERRHVENQYTAASVIARDVSPFMHYVIIDRGSDDGLRKGMPVITQQGLVGSIAAVTAGAARVQLINDPGSSINVILQQSDVEAVLNGQITGEIELDMISQNATVQPGDLVMTSGLGGNYPANIVIGQVVTIRNEASALISNCQCSTSSGFLTA